MNKTRFVFFKFTCFNETYLSSNTRHYWARQTVNLFRVKVDKTFEIQSTWQIFYFNLTAHVYVKFCSSNDGVKSITQTDLARTVCAGEIRSHHLTIPGQTGKQTELTTRGDLGNLKPLQSAHISRCSSLHSRSDEAAVVEWGPSLK